MYDDRSQNLPILSESPLLVLTRWLRVALLPLPYTDPSNAIASMGLVRDAYFTC